jgi:hypothetical protein
VIGARCLACAPEQAIFGKDPARLAACAKRRPWWYRSCSTRHRARACARWSGSPGAPLRSSAGRTLRSSAGRTVADPPWLDGFDAHPAGVVGDRPVPRDRLDRSPATKDRCANVKKGPILHLVDRGGLVLLFQWLRSLTPLSRTAVPAKDHPVVATRPFEEETHAIHSSHAGLFDLSAPARGARLQRRTRRRWRATVRVSGRPGGPESSRFAR